MQGGEGCDLGVSQLVKDLDLKAFHNGHLAALYPLQVSQLVKDLDLKAFHNRQTSHVLHAVVSQLVKDLDLKAFHNIVEEIKLELGGVTARQRSRPESLSQQNPRAFVRNPRCHSSSKIST